MPESVDQPDVQRVCEAAARKGVSLDVRVFEGSTRTAADAARAVGAGLGQIVKALVFVGATPSGELEAVLCLVSGANRVDVARLAAIIGRVDIRRATADEAREHTGYSIGGIPPIGHRRPMRTFMDPALTKYRLVWAAAGTRNAVFSVAPAILRMLSNATVAPIAADKESEDAGSPAHLLLESSSPPAAG